MKKPNLSKDGIQQFFLANGEKLLLGITVVILLGFFYSALTAKPLDESMSPEAIKTASNSLQTQVGSPTWDEQKKALNLADPPFEKKVDTSESIVPVTPFSEPREWNPALFPELKRRADPKIFPVEELQVAGGAALVAYQPDLSAQTTVAPAGNERAATAAAATNKRIDPSAPLPGAHVQSADAQGKPYVVITGLVPVDKQALEYNDRFALSMPPVLDPNKPPPVTAPQAGMPEVPVYAVALVQRRELTPGMKADAEWPAVDDRNVVLEMNKRYQSGLDDWSKWNSAWANQDIVDLNYTFQCDEIPIPGFDPAKTPQAKGTLTRLVTMPLPPLMLKDWGMEAAHPKIRLNIPEDATITPGVNQGGATSDLNFGNNPTENPGGMQAPPTTGTPTPPAAPPPKTSPPPAFAPASPARGGFGGYAARGRGGDHDERPSFGGGYRPQVPSVTYAAPTTIQSQSVPNKLFRFVDFTVEPGKTYQFRVQLLLMNPNFGLKPECLEKADTSNSKWAKSPVTEPTPPITVPRLYQVLAESLTGGRNAEPKATINFLALFKAPPSETASVATSAREVWVEGMRKIDNWILGSILTVRDLDFTDVFDPTAMELRTLKTATVDTDQPMLLDVRNDDPLGSSKTKGPTEMLIIDSAGNLSVASSAVDHFAWDEFNQMKSSATTSSGAAPAYSEHAQPTPPKTTTTPPRKRGRED